MNGRSSYAFACLFTLLAALTARAVLAAPMTPAEALAYKRMGDLHVSPDGRTLAFVVYSYPDDWRPKLWLADVATGTAHSLTPAKKSERAPRWSPDGHTLAFLSNRDGRTQVYLMPAAGGPAVALTAQKNGVDLFRWSPDGKAIAFLGQADDATDPDKGPQIADREEDLSRLWIVDLASRKVRMIPARGWRIDEMEWSDPNHLLLLATDKLRVEEFTDAVYRLALTGGTPQKIAAPPQYCDDLLVSPDGKRFAVRATRAHGPVARDLFVGTIGGNDLHDASTAIDLAVAQAIWTSPSTIWLRAIDGFHNRLWRLSEGQAPQRLALPLSVDAFDVARDGTIIYAAGDFDRLSEIYVRAPDGKIRQLTHLQPAFIHPRPAEIFRTRSFDGTPVEAALITLASLPGKLPLVLIVHGGPSSNFSATYGWEEAWAQLLVAHGYEALLVNPRGSNGYSEDFVKANRGDWGGGDYKDLMAVLDAVIARGHSDPARLGIGGWSYGGEMSEWAITRTRRFKAAVVGAGVFDQAAEFETENDPAGDEWYFGTPWENPQMFAHNSPSTFIRNARTPTLIFDGEEDRSNPVGQSKGLYRALKHFGVETEMVLYPGEGHSPKDGAYNVDMFTRLLAWYDRYVKGPH